MLDINDMITAQRGQSSVRDRLPAETFLSSDFSMSQKPEASSEASTVRNATSDINANMPDMLNHESSTTYMNMPHEVSRCNFSAPAKSSQHATVHQTCRSATGDVTEVNAETPRPKPLSPKFIQAVRSTQNHGHQPVQPLRSSVGSGKHGQCGNLPPTEPRRDGWAQSDVWKVPHREDLCRDVERRKGVDSLVLQDVRRQSEGRTSKDVSLCGGHGSTARGDLRDGATPGRCTRSDPSMSKSPAQEQSRPDASNDDCRDRGHDRDGRSMGCHGHHDSSGHHERPTTGDDRCSAKPGAKHGERDGGDPESCAPSQSASPVDHILNAGDWGKDFDHDHHQTHHMNSRHKKFQELVHQFTKELQEVSNWEGLRQRPKLQVLEVFCSADSELTRQVNKLGYRASRHGIQEGDLSLKDSRRRLFQTILEERPQHIWFSPTCGPWCAWSVFNESQSAAGFQHVQEQRDKHLFLRFMKHSTSCCGF